jgi:two-component sensor histidine kinase
VDERLQECQGIGIGDVEFLQRAESCLGITADISRADVQLCALFSSTQGLVVAHAAPHSISSSYRNSATGCTFSAEEQPLIFAVMRRGRYGQRKRVILPNAAPLIQEVYPVHNPAGHVIAALVIETNMIAHERQKRRNRYFRQALRWLQAMCAHGIINNVATLSPFYLFDGIYLVNWRRDVVYMSGTVSNMFRTIGVPTNLTQQQLNTLETVDQQLVEQTFASDACHEVRTESEDGRTWERKAIPLRCPSDEQWRLRLGFTWLERNRNEDEHGVDAVFVLLHNATEAVAKQRELEVKSAIIQEVHHRVKNGLQNVAAILRLQARRTNNLETRQHLTDAVNRVLSMSVIHEFLSLDEHRPINVRDVCQRIASQVQEVSRTPSQELQIQVQGPTIRLPASQATPMAMVVNELVMNAIEHGIAQRPQGMVLINLTDLGDAITITITDDGAGLPPDFDSRKHTSLGLQIVQTLVASDLKGVLSINNLAPSDESGPTGTKATITFPKRPLT